MSNDRRDLLLSQFEIAWALTSYHLNGLTTAECLWRPAAKGLHVWQVESGSWRADWPEHEGYDLGPPSIGWLTWHLTFWWSMALDHNFGDGQLTREAVSWPGSAEEVRQRIESLQRQWRETLERLTDDELQSADHMRWPLAGKPLADLFAWANLELMKNAAEIGYARFLYAVRPT